MPGPGRAVGNQKDNARARPPSPNQSPSQIAKQPPQLVKPPKPSPTLWRRPPAHESLRLKGAFPHHPEPKKTSETTVLGSSAASTE